MYSKFLQVNPDCCVMIHRYKQKYFNHFILFIVPCGPIVTEGCQCGDAVCNAGETICDAQSHVCRGKKVKYITTRGGKIFLQLNKCKKIIRF